MHTRTRTHTCAHTHTHVSTLLQMRKAIVEDGVNITGYYLWSYIDNLEWEQGFSEKFGILFNDIKFGLDENAPLNKTHQATTNQTRHRKDSSCWFEEVWKSNTVIDPASIGSCETNW